MTIKISEYLTENVGSHDILDSDALSKDFTEKTGYAPCWPVHTPENTRKAIEGRGLGGELSEKPADRLAYGYQIADYLAKKYADFSSSYEGRGRRFYDCINALEDKGY